MTATLLPQIRTGRTIVGQYYGVAFRGIVRSERPHTMNPARYVVSVSLDAPISIHGRSTDGICVEVDFATLTDKFGTAITGVCGD